MTSDIEQFVAENVPERSTLASALLEYAAIQRGLDVERYDTSITLVSCRGTLVPFHGLNGPDTSRLAELMCSFHDGLRSFLADRDVPVAASSPFVASELKRGLKHATRLGWPVNVRPARLAGEHGVTQGVADPESFRAAWQAAVHAYGKQQGYKRVLVERWIAGERLGVFVVGHEVVAVAKRLPAGASHDVIDLTDDVSPELKSLAVRVVDAIPGLSYAEVAIVLPDSSGSSGSAPVVDSVDPSTAAVAHLPTHGQQRDVADAIIDWYLNSPRWPVPRQLSHTPAAEQLSAVEPLYQGRK